MKAHLRRTRMSAKKVNLVAGMVRGKKVKDALTLLKFTPKKAAKVLYNVIQSAASNATNNFNQNLDDLYVTKIIVTMGPTYKRSMPAPRGRALPIRKRTAHVTVEVGALESGKASKATKPAPKAAPSPKAEATPKAHTTPTPVKEAPAKKPATPKAAKKPTSAKKPAAKKPTAKKSA